MSSAQDLAAEIAQRPPDAGVDASDERDGADAVEDVLPVLDGSADAGVDAAVDVPATDSGDVGGCEGLLPTCVSATTSHICDHDQQVERDVVCPLGCLPDGPRAGACREVTPSNGFGPLTCGDDRVSPVSFDVREATELDPDHGSYSTVTSTILAAPAYVMAFQGGSAPAVGIFHLAHLTIDEGQTLTIRRGATNGVVFLVDGDVEINGTLDVGAVGSAPGAGAALLGSGLAGTNGAGAGGGSFATSGGSGGKSNDTAGGAPGTLYGNSSLIPLFGGSPGGGPSPLGGGGGGVVQISACGKVHLGAKGLIRAVGGGAQPGAAGVAGSGGGSGGGILIEGRDVVIEGAMTANGGAGAGANASEGATAGEDGSTSASVPAAPGRDATGNPAGAGSCASTRAGDAAPTTGLAGGGGGGLGRIRLATMDSSVGGGPPSLAGAVTPTPTVATWATR